MVIHAANAHHARRLFASVQRELGPVAIEKNISTLLSFTSFLPKFLSTRSYPVRSLSYRSDASAVSIDELDHNILRHITAATFTSYGQVARALGVGQSTLTYRIGRLKKEGIVLEEGYLISRSDLVGMSSFRISVKLKRHCTESRQQLFNLCDSHSSIYCLAELLGEYDLELSARVNHPREVPTMVESLRKALPATFGAIEFYPDIETFKSTGYPFGKKPEVE